MIAHLVRHGTHDLLGRVLTGRMPGVHLNQAGRHQAAALATHFAALPIQTIVSSPLERAVQTAQPIANALGLTLRIDPAWTDIDFGAWSGQSFDALAGPEWEAQWQTWNRHRSLAPTPGGETMLAVQARAVAALQTLTGTTVVVSHQDVIRSVLAHALGMSLDTLQRLDLDPGSITTLALGNEIRVSTTNRPP